MEISWGVALNDRLSREELFTPAYGNLVLEVPAGSENVLKEAMTAAGLEKNLIMIGQVKDNGEFTYGDMTVSMDEALAAWTKTLEKVFPTPFRV